MIYCKFFLLFISFVAFLQSILAQPIGKLNNTTVLKKIEQINKLLEEQENTDAIKIANQLLQKYVAEKNNFGEAYILIKLNEITIASENFTNTLKTIEKILEIGYKLKNNEIIGVALLQKAQYLMYTEKQIEADKQFEKAILTLPINSYYTVLAWNDRGYNANYQSNYNLENTYYLNALSAAEKIDDKNGAAMAYNNLSVLYHNIKNNELAIEYAQKSIAIRKELNDLPKLVNSYSNLSQIYLNIDLKEAEKYSQLCKQTAEKLNTENALVTAINTENLIQDQYGKSDIQINNAKKILEIYKKRNPNSRDVARQYLAIGIIMSELFKDSTETLSYIDKGINLSKALQDKVSIRDGYFAKTIFFKIRKDFTNSYENIKLYHIYKDSVINQNTITNIAEIQTKYETEKKENEINRLYTEQKLKELHINQLSTDRQLKVLEIEKQQALIKGNNALARQKEDEIQLLSQKKVLQELEIKQQTEALEKNNLLLQTQQQQLNLNEKEKLLQKNQISKQKQLRNIIIITSLGLIAFACVLFNRFKLKKKIQQQEELLKVRDKIAKDLHDDVGSTLSSIKILSEISYKNIEKDKVKSAALLQKIVVQSEQMQQGISDIVWAVKPDNDKIENLLAKLKEYTNHILDPKGIAIEFNIANDALWKNVAMPQRKNILLICREAINNIAKYAECSKVMIAINALQNNIYLTINDNGKGFDNTKTLSGNGLKNMHSRILDLNGNFTIITEPNKGTELKIKFPLV